MFNNINAFMLQYSATGFIIMHV